MGGDVAQVVVDNALSPSTLSPWKPGREFTSLSWATMLQQQGVQGGCCISNSWVTVDKVFCSDELSMADDPIHLLAACTYYVKSRTEWPITTFNYGLYAGNISRTRTGEYEVKSAGFDPDAEGYEKRSTSGTDACKMVAKCRAKPSEKECKALKSSITWC